MAAIATAKAQVEPSTSSSLSILHRPGDECLNGADTAAGATDASVGRTAWQVASRIGALGLIIVASCAAIEFSNRRHLADSPPASPMPDAARTRADWLARTLLVALRGAGTELAGRFVSQCTAAHGRDTAARRRILRALSVASPCV